MNYAGILDFHADCRPEKVAVVSGALELSYAQLLDRVNALASSLASQGIGQGDIVAVLSFNSPEFLELLFATNRLGAALMPLNYRLAPPEWEYILDHAEASMLFTESHFAPSLVELRERLPTVEQVVGFGPGERPDDWLTYDDLIAAGAGSEVPVVDLPADALHRLMYTSGTTSRPKGVCITHQNVHFKNLGMLVQFGWNSDEITMVGGPLYHVGALDMGGITTLHAGGSLVLQRKFDASDLVAQIERHRATNVWLAPAMVNAVLEVDSLDRYDLSSLRLIMSGGEKMPEARLEHLLDVFPDVWFADAYGLTETVSSDTFVPRAKMREKLGSVGRPLPHNQVRVVDDGGATAPANSIGEVVIRGPKVFNGYWRDPAATDAAFSDGWFHTGDMGRMDEHGYLYIEDRKKDMIVSGGENIASPEVERVLWEHPAVLEAAVVAQPDERWGEVPRAFVVLRPDVHATEPELVAFCQERLAKFKVPRRIDFLAELPRTASGKVLKRELREVPSEPDRR